MNQDVFDFHIILLNILLIALLILNKLERYKNGVLMLILFKYIFVYFHK